MNYKKSLIITIFFALVLFLNAGQANGFVIPANDNAKSVSKGPENSPEIGDGWDLERVDFVHPAKPQNPGSGGGGTDKCYKLMGVKWLDSNISYTINTSNSQGLSPSFIGSTIGRSAENWDAQTSYDLFNDSYTTNTSAVYGVYDGENSIQFDSYPNDGVIAVTSVWYTRIGKRIVEFDMLFNTNYAWGNVDSNPALMDLENIATHELGHAAGMNDIYSTSCGEVTMYGYGTEGEIKKRSLEQPDIDGLRKMYGI